MPPKGKLAGGRPRRPEELGQAGRPLARVVADDPGAGEGADGPALGVPARCANPPVSARLRPEAGRGRRSTGSSSRGSTRPGSSPRRRADRRTLIRRWSFDLIGLPPTPEEVAAFEADTVARRLREGRRPAAGVARTTASAGGGTGSTWPATPTPRATSSSRTRTIPGPTPTATTSSASFNEDLPYDRFVVEQIAADRLPPGRRQAGPRRLGFLTVGGRFMNNVHDILDDRIDVVTRGLLGLTVTCARCHDHKFDPIPTADYYSLYGVFASLGRAERRRRCSSRRRRPTQYRDVRPRS